MHNLTLKNIIKMEQALSADLIYCESDKEYEYVFLGMIDSSPGVEKNKEDYVAPSEINEYSIAM